MGAAPSTHSPGSAGPAGGSPRGWEAPCPCSSGGHGAPCPSRPSRPPAASTMSLLAVPPVSPSSSRAGALVTRALGRKEGDGRECGGGSFSFRGQRLLSGPRTLKTGLKRCRGSRLTLRSLPGVFNKQFLSHRKLASEQMGCSPRQPRGLAHPGPPGGLTAKVLAA